MNPNLQPVADQLHALVEVCQKDIWDKGSAVAVGATLIVVIIYTILTYRLAKESKRQTAQNAELVTVAQSQHETEIAPVVILTRTPDNALVLKNVGKGPAFNVLLNVKLPRPWALSHLTWPDVLAAGEAQCWTAQFFSYEEDVGSNLTRFEINNQTALHNALVSDWGGRRLPHSIPVVVSYTRLDGVACSTHMSLESDGVELRYIYKRSQGRENRNAQHANA